MKAGDTVVCVHAEGVEHALTNGRSYVVSEGHLTRAKSFITIENDNGNKIDYAKERFKTLEEIREEKLNELRI